MNHLDDYFNKHVVITGNYIDRIKTTVLYDSFCSWLRDNHPSATSLSRQAFNSYLDSLGFEKKISNGVRFFSGLRLVEDVVESRVEDAVESRVEDAVGGKVEDPVFIAFNDFFLHVPSFSAIKHIESEVLTIRSYPFSLRTVLDLFVNSRVVCSQVVYPDIAAIVSYSSDPRLQVAAIFSCGHLYSQSVFHRNLLIFDTFDEFSSFCSSHSL